MAGIPLKRPVVPDGCYDCSGEGWVFLRDVREVEPEAEGGIVGTHSMLWGQAVTVQDGQAALCETCDGWGRDEDKDWEESE
jgi:hypothetical protein